MTVDVDITLGKAKPRPPLVNSRVAVAGVAVERALGLVGRRLLQRGRGEIVVLTVPTAEWVEPVMNAVRLLARHKTLVVAKGKTKEVAEALAGGTNVLGVSTARDRDLGPLFDEATRFLIGPPDTDLLRHAMKRCLTGRAPASLHTLQIGNIDFDRLCAAMPMATTKTKAVKRLAQMQESTHVAAEGLKLPALADAVEFGEARLWGLELARDFADLQAGRISWRDAHRGAVFVSEPGVGKSTLSRILAKACDAQLVMVSVSELFAGKGTGHLGDVIKNLRRTFDEARAKSPSILFLDELSSLPRLSTLGSSQNADFWRPVVHEFYLQLDSAMHDRTGVVVIGATNDPDLDPALVRPGRLERVIHIERPTSQGLANILRTQLGDDLPGVDLMPLATSAEGATAAVAMDWVRGARRLARIEGRPLRLVDLQTQILAEDNRTREELHRAAVHEAAHAIVGEQQGLTLLSVSVQRVGQSGGRAKFAEARCVTASDMGKLVRMILAGMVGEQLICGSSSMGSGGDETSDLARATEIVAVMRVSYGAVGELRWRGVPTDAVRMLAIDRDLARRVEIDLRKYRLETAGLVRRYRSQITHLADRLLANALTVNAMPSSASSRFRSRSSSDGPPFIFTQAIG